MKKKNYLRGLVVAAVTVALAGAGTGAYAVTTAAGPSVVNVTGPDHQRLTFTLAPGASRTFRLPAANDPVRIDLDTISTNGGIQTPSEVFSALVNVDGNGVGMSWIGTSSDGSQAAGNTTEKGASITRLTCGSNCVVATLSAVSARARTVMLTANAATSSIDETYVVNIWY